MDRRQQHNHHQHDHHQHHRHRRQRPRDASGDGDYRMDSLADSSSSSPAPPDVSIVTSSTAVVDVDSSAPAQQQQQQNGPKWRRVVRGLVPKVRWHPEAVDNLLSGFSGLYAMILVCAYLAVLFTELVTFPDNQLFLEINGFFLYLYLVGVAFFAYVLVFVLRDEDNVVDNHKSHGSLTIRLGALIFSGGTLCYFALELISFIEVRIESPCFHPTLGANVVAAIIFTVLQTYIVFVYPRLNLAIHTAIDRFGLMHIVATNIILWVRTLMKESLHEIAESEEEAHGLGEHEGEEVDESLRKIHDHGNCSFMADRIRQYEHKQQECLKYHNDLLGDALLHSSPYLYPFVIEYNLIGASVAFIMWRHVGRSSSSKTETDLPVRTPDPKEFLRKGDWSHSFKGMMLGIVAMLLAALNLALFFGLEGHQANEFQHTHYVNEAEYYSKATNTALNAFGIAVLMVGIMQIQDLKPKPKHRLRGGRRRQQQQRGSSDSKPVYDFDDEEDEEEEDSRQSSQLDMALLRFTAFFAYLYLSFTVITGAFNHSLDGFPNALHIVNGVVEAAQITLQIVFILELKDKTLPVGGAARTEMPGRQVTVFLSLLNLAQWIVFTFEIQKVRASVVEAEFYGFMPWVIIQRVTLPLTVFFRFHSAVVNMELWKEIYCI